MSDIHFVTITFRGTGEALAIQADTFSTLDAAGNRGLCSRTITLLRDGDVVAEYDAADVAGLLWWQA